MTTLLLWIARLSGLAGTLLLLVSGVTRASGMFLLGNLSVGTMMNGGTALLAFASFCYLLRLVEYPPRR